MNMNRTINILSTSRTALILLLATLLTATAAQTARADNHVSCRVVITTPTNGSITVTRNDTHEAVASGTILPQGTTITVTATPDNGFDLKELQFAIWTYKYTEGIGPLIPAGWVWSSDGGALISNGATYTIEENKEYRFNAKFDQNVVKYSITQNITGSGSLEVTSESVAGNQISVGYTPGDGCELTSFSVTKADNSNVSVNYDKDKDKYFFTMPAANVTVHAVFTANDYTVHFDANANDATGTMANQTFIVGRSQALTSNGFSRTNYVFAGWNTASDGSGTAYADGASVTDLALLGETITLYAQWKATYTVHFDANATDATGTMANQTFIVGQSQALTSNGFSRTNYVFAGWNTASDGSGTAYADGASVTDLTTTVGATITLYAQWKTPVNAEYVDADGTQKIMTGCLEITPDNMPTILSGNCYVKESVTYANKVTITGNTTIILANGATMSVGTEAAPLGGGYAIYDSGSNCLTIYGQSLDAATAGRLEVYSTGYAGVKLYSGSYTQHSGNVKVCHSGGSTNNTSIYAGGSVTIDGGTLYASIASEHSRAISASGNISITGGDVTANATGANSYGMLSVGNITLGWTRATDRITATSYRSNLGTVSLSKRFAFDDGGTVTLATTDNIGGKTLRPAALVTFDANGGSDVAAQPVYIGTAATEPTPTRTGYTVGGWKLGSSDYDFATLATGDITLTAQWIPDPDDFAVSSDGNTYTIKSAAGWGVFCDALQDNDTYNRFSGKTVKLGADITVSRMAGSDHHDFCGTFDGDGHTLTFNYGTSGSYASDEYAAPFHYVSNVGSEPATIKNLHVTGHIYTSAKYAAGLIAQHWGTVNVENCRVSTVIHSSVNGDGTHGGFEAECKGVLNITGCVFDGKLLTTTTNGTFNCGGFVGWHNGGTTNISNSLYAPAAIATGEREVGPGTAGQNPSATFGRNAVNSIANSYYTRTLGTAQGKQLRTIAAGEGVTLGHDGVATEYSVSGITAYKASDAHGDNDPFIDGLVYNEVLYAGSGDAVSLTLANSSGDAPLGYKNGDYSVTGGATLSGSTLTMADEDVTVSFTPGELRSTHQAVPVSYIDADGILCDGQDGRPDPANAIALDGTEDVLGQDGQETWYFVGADISYGDEIDCYDDVNIILTDGKTMTVTSDAAGIYGDGGTLTIYGQTLGTGTLDITATNSGIFHYDGNVVICGGTVNATGTNSAGINAYGAVTITGGQITATSNINGINAYEGNITLGWTNATDFIKASSYFPGDGKSVNIANGQSLYNGSEVLGSGTVDDYASKLDGKTLVPYIESTTDDGTAILYDNDAGLPDGHRNADRIATLATDGTAHDIMLMGRTLYKDGAWNTLVLPFALGDDQAESGHELDGTPLEGATLMTLGNSQACNTGFDPQTGTLNLEFLPAKTVEPGVAYIVKWPIPDGMTPDDFAAAYAANPDAYDLKNPVFTGVTVANDNPAECATTSDDGYVTFVGTYGPAAIYADPAVNLYLGAANKLYWPTATDFELKPFRAYFQLNNGLTAGEPTSLVRAFALNFGEETTGIISIHNSQCTIHNEAGAWYTLDGRKLQAQPTRKGLYIHRGKKVVIP